MADKPKISVVMSVYNAESYLKEAIESVLKQSFTDFEFIIVDDGSTDRSFRIISSYDDDRIKLLRNKVRIGLTKSLNKALRIAKGEYIARQDADDISFPHRFEYQIKFFEKNAKVVLLGTSIYIIDEKGRILGVKKGCPRPTLSSLLKHNEFIHGSVMFKKAIIDKLGGYDELFKYSQDYELWLRIAKHYDVRNLQIPLYALRIRRGSVGFTRTKEQFLYQMLARKIAMQKLKVDKRLKNLIKNYGIECICSSLNFWEKLSLYEAQARSIFSGYLWQSTGGRTFLKAYHFLRSRLQNYI